METMLREKEGFICDMDGVIYHGNKILPGVRSENAVMIGDRMDTDIIAGIESGLTTVLVLSGVTTREECEQYPYRPNYILNGVSEVMEQ